MFGLLGQQFAKMLQGNCVFSIFHDSSLICCEHALRVSKKIEKLRAIEDYCESPFGIFQVILFYHTFRCHIL